MCICRLYVRIKLMLEYFLGFIIADEWKYLLFGIHRRHHRIHLAHGCQCLWMNNKLHHLELRQAMVHHCNDMDPVNYHYLYAIHHLIIPREKKASTY